MAGLSLVFYLNESNLRDRKVLVIDRSEKKTNDHTWSFWEKEKSAFEEIVFRRWNKIWFHGTRGFSENLSLKEYKYKMIRAIDFYEFVKAKINLNPNFSFLQAEISEVENGIVKTDLGDFAAKEFIFDSFTRRNYDNPKYQNLWQHFLGWTVETEEAVFDETSPTLFDFRVEQADECRFVYILPFSKTEALVEFTIFSDNILEEKEYEVNLRNYFLEILDLKNFKILETEKGVIPMSDEPHEEFADEKTIRIGTAGGYVKPSTGYSFKRTQRRLQKLVESLSKEQIPKNKFQNKKWKSYLDSILLNVLRTKKHPAADVFSYLFKENNASQVLKFLDEETSFTEDLRIMQTVPIAPFTKAALQTLLKKLG